MKVCILTTAFPKSPGDDNAPFILDAARALARAGVGVRVIAMHVPGTKDRENWDGIEIIRTRYLPERFEILRKEGGGLPVVWRKKPLARLAILPFLFFQAIQLIRYTRDCDIIHANWTLSGIICWITSFFHRRPYVVTVHGSDIYEGTK
jgi:hypothetical protein